MQNTRKLLSVLLAAYLILSVLIIAPVSVGAEQSGKFWYDYNDDNTVTITDYDGEASELTIPSELDGHTVTGIGSRAFNNCRSLIKVTIPDTVTVIGDSAFSGCSSLANITIPDSVKAVGSDAFSGTAWFNNQPDGLVYVGKIAYKIKGTCPVEVDIQQGTEGISGSAFNGCYNMAHVTIPGSVKSIGDNAFAGCRSLTEITIPVSVTNIGIGVFANCRALTTVDLPSSITVIPSNMFSGCSSLASVTIPGSVASIENGAFQNTGLTSVIVPNSVTEIGGSAFYRCKALASVTLSDSLTEIGSSAFYGCESIGGIILPASVTAIGSGAFEFCKALTSIVIPDGVKTIEENTFEYCSSLASVTIGSSVEAVCASAFESCKALTSITFPLSVKKILYHAFNNCTALKSAVIPYTVMNIFESFAGCNQLTITGYDDTDAAQYAADNGIPFISLGARPSLLDESEYGLWISGIAVTAENCSSVTGDGISGSISYDPVSKVLTLKDATVRDYSLCYFQERSAYFAVVYSENDIELRLEGANLLTNTDYAFPDTGKPNITFYGLLAPEKSVVISGSGSLGTSGVCAKRITLAREAALTCSLTAESDKISMAISADTFTVNGSLTVNQISALSDYSAINARVVEIVKGASCTVSIKRTIGNVVTIRGYIAKPVAGIKLAENGSLAVSGTVEIESEGKAPGNDFSKAEPVNNGYGIYCPANGTVTIDSTGSLSITANKYALQNVDVTWNTADTMVTIGSDQKPLEPGDDIFDALVIHFTPSVTIICGDADGDSIVTVFDATSIQRHLAGNLKGVLNKKAADADSDGSITILDVTEIQRYLAAFPVNDQIGKKLS